jgi:RNA polymerase sigma factor (sigma-70 family)
VDSLEDCALCLQAASDPNAFGEIFERHAQAVYAFCCWRTGDPHLSEDLTSMVFLEAWRRRSVVTFTGVSARPWLLGVANNVSRNATRSMHRYREALNRVPNPQGARSAEDDAVSRLDAERTTAAASVTLASLAEAEREIVLLVFWSGLSYEETAEALGVPVGTVRSRVSRTRAKVRAALGSVEFNAEEV